MDLCINFVMRLNFSNYMYLQLELPMALELIRAKLLYGSNEFDFNYIIVNIYVVCMCPR